MWAVEHSVETSARAQAVWRLWADVDRWPEWNAGVERIELRGPFAVGSTILMTPPGDEPVELRITEAIEPELFVDEADGGDFVVRTTHLVEAVGDERSRITYRMEITGPARRDRGPGDRSGDQRRLPAGARSAGGARRASRLRTHGRERVFRRDGDDPARPG
jgi:Polyketide cyclase / dehydrase and lipid transport